MKNKVENIDKLVLKKKKLSKKEKTIPFLVVGVILLSLLIFSKQIYSSILISSENIKKNAEELDKLKKQRQILSALESGGGTLELDEQFVFAEKHLPSYKPSLITLINLNGLAKKEKVNFSGLELSPGKIKNIEKKENSKNSKKNQNKKTVKFEDSLNQFNITFSIWGKRDNIMSFVNNISKINPMMMINKMSTSIEENKDEELDFSIMRASLDITVFYQDMPKIIDGSDLEIESFSTQELELLRDLSQRIVLDIDLKGLESGVPLGGVNPFVVQ